MRRLIVTCYRVAGWLSRCGFVYLAVRIVAFADRLAQLAPAPLVISKLAPRMDLDALRAPTLVIWDLNAVARGERVRGAFRGREGRA